MESSLSTSAPLVHVVARVLIIGQVFQYVTICLRAFLEDTIVRG